LGAEQTGRGSDEFGGSRGGRIREKRATRSECFGEKGSNTVLVASLVTTFHALGGTTAQVELPWENKKADP
jgi:hypothetical protein